MVYGFKQGPYITWIAKWKASGSFSETVPANSYYGIVQNVSIPSYFGSYEEDEIADFLTPFISSSDFKTAQLMIQGDHMDSTIFTHWFS